jgi:hypothetical protein
MEGLESLEALGHWPERLESFGLEGANKRAVTAVGKQEGLKGGLKARGP